MKVAILGYGGRGEVYANSIKQMGSQVVAICDPQTTRKQFALDKYGLSDKDFYTSEDEFFSKGKIADVLVISTMDTLHCGHFLKAMDAGYDVLLEKPIGMSMEECELMLEKQKKTNNKVVVCHVLRYTPFWNTLKDIVDSKEYGEVINVRMVEDIGYYHYAHSFVRGNWRNEELSAPLILAKNCHDLDIIAWVLGKKCLKVNSIGDVRYFKPEHAPEGSADYCVDCKCADTCPYNAFKIYNNAVYEDIAGCARHGRLGSTPEEINKNLSDKNNLFGRCVFKCDNDLVDNQFATMVFEDNISVNLLSTAFTEDIHRKIDIYCTNGFIERLPNGNFGCTKFGGEYKEVVVPVLEGGYKHHGGGDIGIIKSLIDYIDKGIVSRDISSLEMSMQSHKMGFLMEKSRKNNGKFYNLDE